MTFIHPDDAGFTYSSDTEWDRAEAQELGAANPDRAWVLTDRDVWHANPFYAGPPQRHPEDDGDLYDDEPVAARRADEADLEIPF